MWAVTEPGWKDGCSLELRTLDTVVPLPWKVNMHSSRSKPGTRRRFIEQLGAAGLILAGGKTALAFASRLPDERPDVSKWLVSRTRQSEFTNANGVYQDGMLALARDRKNTLWAVVGHSRIRGLSVWKGTRAGDLRRQHYAKYVSVRRTQVGIAATWMTDFGRPALQCWPVKF